VITFSLLGDGEAGNRSGVNGVNARATVAKTVALNFTDK